MRIAEAIRFGNAYPMRSDASERVLRFDTNRDEAYSEALPTPW